ncbi:MAG: ABC transporter permease [Verrucomicrobia bacterium]|nr:ABC transporter permease [Verrucomicrobiota bacterium]MBS0646769.1 ABC transporter permease [Verrucomicrobiota bacterium]
MRYWLLKLYASFVGVGRWAICLRDTTQSTFKRLPSYSLLLDQLYQIGVLSLPVVAITGFSTGLVLAAQAFYQLGDKGLASATGLLVGKGMLTEVGPVLTAFMVTGRVGSAMTATIGTMRVTEQIDALKTMSVNPLRYLVAPRVISSILMLPALTVFSAVTGIFGGYLISVHVFGMAPEAYFNPMPAEITTYDLAIGIIKALVFGFLISTIACYQGLNTKGGASGVGRSTTTSVVVAYSCILIINFILTVSLNSLHIVLQDYLGWR